MDRLAAFARTRSALVLAAAWGLAEAIALPVVPDVLLGVLVLAAPGTLIRLFGAVVAGALAGTAVLYALTLADPAAVAALLLALPGIDPAMLAGASATVAGGDPTSIALFGPGTPLKVFTYAWATGPAMPLALMVGAALNRGTRILPGLVVMAVLGRVAPAFVRRHQGLVLALYSAIWLAMYVTLWA